MVSTQVKTAINVARQFHAPTHGITQRQLATERLRFLDGVDRRLWGMCACLIHAHELNLITRDDVDAARNFIRGYVPPWDFVSNVIGSENPADISAWWDDKVGAYAPSTCHFETRFNTVL